MKKVYFSLALMIAIAFSAQVSYSASWCGCHSKSMSFISYLNPLPYLGIGENRTNFSLNPFTGFKNCDKCKVKRVAYCESTCNTCQKAIQPRCDSCNNEYVAPIIVPKCSSCGR